MKKPLILAALFMAACSTTPSKEAAQIIEADERGTENCKFLGTVEGSSNYGGLAAQEVGLKRAKNEALEKAYELGATHIVWGNTSKGYWGGNAAGRAYRCGGNQAARK